MSRILLKSWSSGVRRQPITFSNFEEAKAYIEEKGTLSLSKADGLALRKDVLRSWLD